MWGTLCVGFLRYFTLKLRGVLLLFYLATHSDALPIRRRGIHIVSFYEWYSGAFVYDLTWYLVRLYGILRGTLVRLYGILRGTLVRLYGILRGVVPSAFV